jgi:hypothetical protein
LDQQNAPEHQHEKGQHHNSSDQHLNFHAFRLSVLF